MAIKKRSGNDKVTNFSISRFVVGRGSRVTMVRSEDGSESIVAELHIPSVPISHEAVVMLREQFHLTESQTEEVLNKITDYSLFNYLSENRYNGPMDQRT